MKIKAKQLTEEEMEKFFSLTRSQGFNTDILFISSNGRILECGVVDYNKVIGNFVPKIRLSYDFFSQQEQCLKLEKSGNNFYVVSFAEETNNEHNQD